MAVEYVLPDKEKDRIKSGYKKFLMAESILKKLAAIGEPNPEAEAKVEELRARARRFADVFDVDLEEE